MLCFRCALGQLVLTSAPNLRGGSCPTSLLSNLQQNMSKPSRKHVRQDSLAIISDMFYLAIKLIIVVVQFEQIIRVNSCDMDGEVPAWKPAENVQASVFILHWLQ